MHLEWGRLGRCCRYATGRNEWKADTTRSQNSARHPKRAKHSRKTAIGGPAFAIVASAFRRSSSWVARSEPARLEARSPRGVELHVEVAILGQLIRIFSLVFQRRTQKASHSSQPS